MLVEGMRRRAQGSGSETIVNEWTPKRLSGSLAAVEGSRQQTMASSQQYRAHAAVVFGGKKRLERVREKGTERSGPRWHEISEAATPCRTTTSRKPHHNTRSPYPTNLSLRIWSPQRTCATLSIAALSCAPRLRQKPLRL